jgi:cytoskeletal protein CcmA (bactofilin family)
LIFRKRRESLELIIGPASSVTGSLSTPGVARIDGKVEGTITADWLIVAETGYLKGDALTRVTMVAGRVEGTIRANERVEIGFQGIVEGDIYTTNLRVSEGACFDGHSYMRRIEQLDGREVLPFQKGGKPSLGTTAASDGFDEP